MKIDRVRSLHVSAEWDYHEPLGEAGLARPAFIYPELEAREPRWPIADMSAGPPYPVDAHFLLIDSDEGATGICGPIGEEDIAIIQRYFADLLIGENPHAVERIWDKMYRHAIHGRKGTPMMALSKVDLAHLGPQREIAGRACLYSAGRAIAPQDPCLRLDARLFKAAK